MRIPKIFYYQNLQIIKKYREFPPGQPDIQRILDGAPPWVNYSASSMEKPKKLILETNLLFNLNYTRLSALCHLCEMGFELYLVHNQNLSSHPLRQGDLREAFFYPGKFIVYAYSSLAERLEKAIAVLKCPYDELQILDEHWLDCMIDEHKNQQQRWLYLSRFISLTPELLVLYLDDLSKSRPAVTRIINDSPDLVSEELKSMVTKKFPDLELETVYLHRTNPMITDECESLDVNSVFSIEDLALTLETHPNLKNLYLNFGHSTTPHDLKSLPSLPLLRSISLESFFQENFVTPIDAHKLGSAKIIDCSRNIIIVNENLKQLQIDFCEPETVSALLEQASGLKYLSLSGTNCLELDFKKFNLRQLETLVIQHDNALTSDQLQTLVNDSNLNTLILNLKSLIPPCAPLDLSKIDNLTLFEHLELNTLSAAAPNLKKLSLRLYETLEFFKLWNELNLASSPLFSKLSYCQLSFPCEDINPPEFLQTLQKLHCVAPKLQELDLSLLNLSSHHLSHPEIATTLARFPRVFFSTKCKPKTYSLLQHDLELKPHTEKSKQNVDVDTRKNTAYLHAQGIFYSSKANLMSPTQYRLMIFSELKILDLPKDINEIAELYKTKDLDLIPCKLEYSKVDVYPQVIDHDDRFYGKQKLVLDNSWQALASLNPNERLIAYHHVPDIPLEIQYSQKDNLYYIRKTSPGFVSLEIDFCLEINKTPELIAPPDIQSLILDLRAYSSGRLQLAPDLSSGLDYISELIKQRKGACRHRTLAFKYLMSQAHPEVPVRIINNEVHSFIEIYLNSQWTIVDLGGYEAELIINTKDQPRLPQTSSQESSDTTLSLGQELETWKRYKSKPRNLKEYCQRCLQPNIHKSLLIEFNCDDDVDAMHYALQKHAKETHRPLFYVNDPSDLICSAPYGKRGDDDRCSFHHGPGGALYDFIQTASENPVIVINYSHFSPDEIVGFNTLFDKDAKVDGVYLPSDVLIIALLNINHPNCYQGADFYSRMDKTEICPLSSEELAPAIPPLAIDIASEEVLPKIHLYHAADWKTKLLGGLVMREDGPYYQNGELQKLLATGVSSFEIHQGLWKDPEFLRFWREAFQQGYIFHAQRRIDLPSDIKIRLHDEIDWERLNLAFKHQESLKTQDLIILNPTVFSKFFNQYNISESNEFIQHDGIIKQHAGKTLNIYLTRNLNEDEWARLLEECLEHKVILETYCAPNVSLSLNLLAKTSTLALKPRLSPDQVIQTQDIDASVARLLQEDKENSLVIDVSECEAYDLIERLHTFLNSHSLRIEAQIQQCALTKALAEGKRIILQGKISAELADELAPLLMQRQTLEKTQGSIIIVSLDIEHLNYVHATTDQFSFEEKQALLRDAPPELEISHYVHENLGQLRARATYLKAHPGKNSDDSWAGMLHLPVGRSTSVEFRPSDAAEETSAFIIARQDKVRTMLEHAPYVFLSGLSGVGKSTFVEKHLCDENDLLFRGELEMKRWAQELGEGRHILFLDEANLSSKQWTEFEGLFQNPPSILIEGELYPLSPNHKVVFAANPISYGSGRRLADFFVRHGNSVIFDPIPPAVVYEQILKPIFIGTRLDTDIEKICTSILELYNFVCSCSETEILISPRELEMMALMIILHYENRQEEETLENIVSYFTYTLAKSLIPPKFQEDFNSKFKPKTRLMIRPSIENPEFIVTSSRIEIAQLMDDLLTLREFRQTKASHDSQKFGGLGGLVLEGVPGIGKSELIIAVLRARSYQEVHDFSKPTHVDKPFYRLPASMSLSDQTKLLIKAFHEGAIVVMDEINTNLRLERLLNDLLMGKSPEGKRPDKPGFMVLGSQNPTTMAGRKAASTALSRRMICFELPLYSKIEIFEILCRKGLSDKIANTLTEIYFAKVEEASQKHLTPAPCFRDLMKLTNHYQSILSEKSQASISALSLFQDPSCSKLPESPRQDKK